MEELKIFSTRERNEGPEGYRYAVFRNERIIAWFERSDDAEAFTWSKMLQNMMSDDQVRIAVGFLMDYFETLMNKNDTVVHAAADVEGGTGHGLIETAT